MFPKLQTFASSATFKDSLVVFVTTAINVLLGALFFVITPRILGPASFGIFSTVIAVSIFVVNFANFGVDSSVLRFGTKQNLQDAVFSFAFKIYVYVGLFVAAAGFVLSSLIAHFLNQPELSSLLKIAFGFTIFLLLTNFFVAALQAKREFAKAALVNISSNLARLSILIIAVKIGVFGLYQITLLFFAIAIISAIVGKILLPIKFAKYEPGFRADFLSYNLWVGMTLIITSLPYDNIILLKIAGATQAGYYAAPFKLLSSAYQLGGNFTRVLASRFASFDSDEKAITYGKKSFIFIIPFIVGLILLILISKSLVMIFLGAEFENSGKIMQILSLGFIFFFASLVPSSIILYYFAKPKINFIISVARVILFVIALILFTSNLKAIGAASAFLLAEATAFFLMSAYVVYKFKFSNE